MPGRTFPASNPDPGVVRPAVPRSPAPQDLGIADTHDVLFFGEARLVRLRVHLRPPASRCRTRGPTSSASTSTSSTATGTAN